MNNELKEKTEEKAHFWPIFFKVFFAQLVFSVMGIFMLDTAFYPLGLLLVVIIPFLAFIAGIIMAVKKDSKPALSWIGSSILSTLATLLIGIGVCFSLLNSGAFN